MKKVVYTCITGGYDNVPKHKYVNPDWDYVLFTDNADLIRTGRIYHWTVKPLAYKKMDNVRNARWHKINAHKLFPGYKYSLWIDGNGIINNKKVFNLMESLIKKQTVISIPLHPDRDCIYDEGFIIKQAHIDYEDIVDQEMYFLCDEQYPAHNGLSETNIMLRRHNDIAPSLNLWWKMVRKYSKRDQLSCNYAMWKHNINIIPMYSTPGEHRTNGDFTFVYPNTHNQDKIKSDKPPHRIFQNTILPNGRRHIYLFGIKVFSYKKRSKTSKYDKIYAKRFNGLTQDEARFILEKQFLRMAGYPLNLDNPKTFNEKIQWLKLYYHNPLMTKCADKVAVRDYIKEKIGAEYLIPIIGVYDNVDDIDWDVLPDKFVAKVNWGSGQNIICTDKSKLDIADAKQKLVQWTLPESNHYYDFLEWVYKDIPPKIIIEEYIEQLDSNIQDYRFFCFNGVVQQIWLDVLSGSPDHKRHIYDRNWNLLDIKVRWPSINKNIKKPENLDKMIRLAEILSHDFPHVRVDFYNIQGKIYFGELTFSSMNGTGIFEPFEWDRKLGTLLTLPDIKN